MDTPRAVAMSVVDAGTSQLKKAGTWWWKQLALRLGFYVLALGFLGWVSDLGYFFLTAIVAIGVGVLGILLHRALTDKPQQNDSALTVKILVWAVLIEVGIGICIYQHWRVLGTWGFVGLSLAAFGVGQLAAEIRAAKAICGTVALLLTLNCIGAAVLAVLFGTGGWLLLGAAIVLLYSSVGFGTEFVLDRMDTDAWKPTGRHMVLGGIGIVALAIGAAGLTSVGGVRFAVVVGVILLIVIVMIASNTDSDLLFALFVVAVIGSQISPDDAVPPAFNDGADQHSILVLGDSYISGEGAQDYFVGTNTRDPDTHNECRRSDRAWAVLVHEATKLQLNFVACSGAKAINILDRGQYVGENPDNEYSESPAGEPGHIMSQVELYRNEHRAAALDWVFITIGGNDAGFGDLVAECLAPGDCSLGGQRRLDDLRLALEPRLHDLYQRLDDEFPKKVVVVPYPVPIRETGCDIFDSTFTDREHRFLAGFTEQMDAVIRRVAAEEGLRFVATMPSVFDDANVRICETDAASAAVNYFALNPVGGDIDPRGWVHNSMHPKESGHVLMAAKIVDWLASPTEAEDPATVPAPVLSLTDVMCDEGAVCNAADTGVEGDPEDATTAFQGTRLAARHHLWAIVLMVSGAWTFGLAALHRRRLGRKQPADPQRWTISKTLDAMPAWLRAVSCAGLVAVTIGFLLGLAWVAGLADGYGGAQSEQAAKLKARPATQWDTFFEMAWRDIVVYVPLYVVYGITVIKSVRPGGAPRDRRQPWVWAMVALAALAAADLAETTLFQWSLRRLRSSGAAADIGSITSITEVLTWVKLGFGAVTLVLVCVTAFRRRESGATEPQHDDTSTR